MIADKIYGSVVDSLPPLGGKCYAITGSTSGTGYWAAVAAVRKGAACVIMLNRKSSRADEAQEAVQREGSGCRVVTVECDLMSFASVRAAAAKVKDIASEFGGLDALVNNAGIMAVPDTRTADGHDVQMQSNHLSHFLLTNLLMPSLEAAAAKRGEARIVQHSSGARGTNMAAGEGLLEASFFSKSEAGSLGGDAIPACFNRYHQTKLSNSVFAMALHDKLGAVGSRVKSLCAEPGVSATSLMTNMSSGHAAAAASKPTAPKAPKAAKPKDGAGKEKKPAPAMNFKPQSAADGACPLMLASFGSSANSGDFYMPGELDEGTPVGTPAKCMTDGKPTPTTDYMKKAFKNEALTMDDRNRVLLWTESEKVTQPFAVKQASKL